MNYWMLSGNQPALSGITIPLCLLSRHFDKDEDGKLSMEELREVMVSMGEGPLQEKEFNSFITVII